MRILVDHGAFQNLGDIGMLESAVSHLRRALPEAELGIVDRAFRSTVWDDPGVHRQPNVRPRLDPHDWPVRLLGYRLLRTRLLLPLLGRGLEAGRLTLGDGTDLRLRQFCGLFDALLVTGGGFLTDKLAHEMFCKCALILGFAEQGKPVICTGQQIGPFGLPWSRGLVARALRSCAFIGLRDPVDSVAFCRKARLAPGQFSVLGDDSLGLAPCPDTEIDDLVLSSGINHTQDFLAVNLRVSPRYAAEHGSHMQFFAQLVERLIERTGRPALVVPIALGTEDSDVETGRVLASHMHGSHLHVLCRTGMTPAAVKGVLGRAWGAVGTSYHFCTFAASMGVPVACLYDGSYYSQKARAVAAFWADQRLVFSLREQSVDEMAKQILRTLNDPAIRVALRSRASIAVEQWESAFEASVQAGFTK